MKLRLIRNISPGSLCLALVSACAAQSLTQRIANETLKLPATTPTFGYRTVNAFGSLAFTAPLAIASPPGETNRLFVVEQRGRIVVITNMTAPTRTVFLDISTRVQGGVPTDERGLLGLAFHPGYATNRYFFVYYSTLSTTSGVATNALHQRLSRFQTLADDSNKADPDSELIFINQNDRAPNHNGGDLHFGPDAYLYVSLGDEGNQQDSFNNSQRIDKNFFSGILRIDVDKRSGSLPANPHPSNTNNASLNVNYAIPPDNPFVGTANFNGVAINPANLRSEFFAV